MTEKKATIYDVAKAANVSTATVSMVINDDSRISEDTVGNVRETMNRLNYVARRYRKKRPADTSIKTGRIAIASCYTNVPEGMLQAISQHLKKANFETPSHLYQIGPDLCKAIAGFDGLIVISSMKNPTNSRYLPTDIPIIQAGGLPHEIPLSHDHIMIDNTTVGRIAAESLLDRGHRNIAYLGYSNSRVSQTRFQAFAESLKSNPDVNLIVPEVKDISSNSFSKVVDYVLKDKENKVTGIFCFNDKVTVALYVQLLMRGIDIEQDMEILSCDNTSLLDVLFPRPASIDTNMNEIGILAAEQMIKRLKNRNSAYINFAVQPKLIHNAPVDNALLAK